MLTGALVAAVVASGLGVAGLVGTGDEEAQVNAGPGEGPSLPALVPDPPATSFEPTGLPEGLVLQEVSVEPSIPLPPGSPYAEVYGRLGPDGTMDEAVAVITATAPDIVDALLRESGATTSPVPGQPGQLDIDFGQGLVARSFAADDPETVCGTGGCVEIASQVPSYMVLGRDLDGGAGALPAILDGLELRADAQTPGERVEAPALVADGFSAVYEGDQIPGLSPGPRTVLRYGGDGGARGVTLWIEEGGAFDPASLAWQFPVARTVQVRGHDGLLVANDLLTSVTWQERPGLVLSIDVTGFTDDEALDFASGVEEVSEALWLPVQGVAGERPSPPVGGNEADSVTSNGVVASGPEVVIGEGQAGDQRWQLIGYEVEPASGTGPDVCIELRGGSAVSGGCYQRPLGAAPPLQGTFILETGLDLGGLVLVRGDLDRRVATVRFLFDDGKTLDVATVSHERFGTHVVAAIPLDAEGATVVLLDEAGTELQRRELAVPFLPD